MLVQNLRTGLKNATQNFVAADGHLLDRASAGYRALYITWCNKFILEEHSIVHTAGITLDVRNSITKKCEQEMPLAVQQLANYTEQRQLQAHKTAQENFDKEHPPEVLAAENAAADDEAAQNLARASPDAHTLDQVQKAEAAADKEAAAAANPGAEKAATASKSEKKLVAEFEDTK